MKKPALIIIAIAAAFAVNAPAQTSVVKGSSQPGKASVEQTVDVTATIIGIDRTTRDITLKGPKGNWIVVTASYPRSRTSIRLRWVTKSIPDTSRHSCSN